MEASAQGHPQRGGGREGAGELATRRRLRSESPEVDRACDARRTGTWTERSTGDAHVR